jgi:hypothetical protein
MEIAIPFTVLPFSETDSSVASGHMLLSLYLLVERIIISTFVLDSYHCLRPETSDLKTANLNIISIYQFKSRYTHPLI